MPTTRKSTRDAARPPPFLWGVMDGDSLIMVFSKLSTLADMVNASLVCRAWATAARVEQVWECAVKANFPSELHSGVFHSFETLGIMGWKARCKLLLQRVRPICPKRGWGGQDIKAMYSFVVSVADAEGNAVSSAATLCAPRHFALRFPKSRPDFYFRLEALFDIEAVLNVGAKGDWLLNDPDTIYADGADGFGTATVDVFVRRSSDGRVAHLMKSDFDFENPFPSEGVGVCPHRRVPKDAISPQSGAHDAPELAISIENWSVKPPWLGEHVHDVYPNLSCGRWREDPQFPHSKQEPPSRVRLQWPSHRNGSYDPEWVVGLSAIAKPPQPRELDDDDDDDIEDVEEAKTGKWTGLQLDFSWSDSFGQGEHEPVANDFMAHALAGRALLWV